MVCCCNTIGNLFRLVIVAGCAFALAMQWLNVYSCDFFSVAGSSINVGVWFEGTDGVCDIEEMYSDDDWAVALARSSLTISMICGLASTALVVFEWLLCELPCASCIEGAAFVGAWGCGLGAYALYLIEACGDLNDQLGDDMIAQFGTTVIPDGIRTGQQCEWGQGATYNLLACIAYFGCGILLCCTPKPKPIFK